MTFHVDVFASVLACFGLAVVYVLGSVFYNLFLHPLRSFPGPLLMRATRIAYSYNFNTGVLPFEVLKLHEKYGDVVRVAPDELAFNNVSTWKDIMGHRTQGAAEFEKDPKFYSSVPGMPRTIVNSRGPEHAMLRRQMSHGFSERSLREQEPLIMKYIDFFILRLHQNYTNEEPIDIAAWYNFTTFDIIGDLAFGEPFGCLENSDWHPWIRSIFASARLGTAVQTANRFPFLKMVLFKLLSSKKARESRARNQSMAKAKLEKRIEMGRQGGRPDLIEGLLRKKDELNLSFPQLVANSNTLVIGGSETTATLLSGVTYFLLTNKHILTKLVDEVRTAFQSEKDITIVSVGKLRFMLACLDEALRMYPPIAIGLPRVTPEAGATTTVAVHQWAIHHNEAYFRDPFSFRPERFLADPEFASDNREAFQPFHLGPRNCLGRNLAYVEMRLILARLIWSFDLELAEESRDWVARQKIFILWDKGPLKVRLTPVQRDSSVEIRPE
ncbi:cytochrome p450 [Colletotrichum sojae]|uniref:Cytochrome p450 n=1 Tax=Colletotrichum sojae TaxID=2175907 RepID=A0A8H6JDQ0_9PEZI|nr:cytochrome p450 [Colletotrichum sojae]